MTGRHRDQTYCRSALAAVRRRMAARVLVAAPAPVVHASAASGSDVRAPTASLWLRFRFRQAPQSTQQPEPYRQPGGWRRRWWSSPEATRFFRLTSAPRLGKLSLGLTCSQASGWESQCRAPGALPGSSGKRSLVTLQMVLRRPTPCGKSAACRSARLFPCVYMKTRACRLSSKASAVTLEMLSTFRGPRRRTSPSRRRAPSMSWFRNWLHPPE